MTSYIENYGFAKTYVNHNNKISNRSIQWEGNYDGKQALINMDLNNNGESKHVSMVLDKNDLMKMLELQPVQMSLDKRLNNDFLKKTRKHNKRKHKHKRKRHNKTNKSK